MRCSAQSRRRSIPSRHGSLSETAARSGGPARPSAMRRTPSCQPHLTRHRVCHHDTGHDLVLMNILILSPFQVPQGRGCPDKNSDFPSRALPAHREQRPHLVVPSRLPGQVHNRVVNANRLSTFSPPPALPLSPFVGSEEARLRADLRPPLKLYVPVSGIQLSRRRPRTRAVPQ